MNIFLFPALFAFFLSLALTFAAVKFFPKIGLLDRPHLYGHKRAPIPYYGGTVLYLAFVISVIIFVPLSPPLLALGIAATMISLLGFLDDLFKLSPFLRIFVQFLAASVLVWGGVGILSINLPFIGVLEFAAWMSALFTILWVMTILNTMNFVDGVSGLNSGVTFIAAMTLFFLSINPTLHEDPASQIGVAMISLILAMVSLAFFFFDFPKKILMGDSGSTFLGFVLATLAIFSGGKVATAFLVLGIPILDMVWVVLRRLWEGKKIWHGDLKHLHHRFLDLGLSERKVVILYLLLTALLGVMAVLLVSSQQKFFMIVALLLFMLLLASALVLRHSND